MAHATTLSQALTLDAQVMTVADAFVATDELALIDGEYLELLDQITATQRRIKRGVNGSAASAHAASAPVQLGAPSDFLTGNQILNVVGRTNDLWWTTRTGTSPAQSLALQVREDGTVVSVAEVVL